MKKEKNYKIENNIKDLSTDAIDIQVVHNPEVFTSWINFKFKKKLDGITLVINHIRK